MKKGALIPLNRQDRLLKKVKGYIADIDTFLNDMPYAAKVLYNILPTADNALTLKTIPLFGVVGDKQAIWTLFHLVTDGDNEEAIKRSAALQLNMISPTVSDASVLTEVLVRQLDHADPSVKSNCALALGWKNNLAAVDPLREHISDADRDVQAAVVTALSTIGGADVFNQLSLQLQTESVEVKRCILLNLWRFEDQLPRVEAIYLDSMETLPAGLRLDAMSGLAMLPLSTTILKGYRQFLTDADPQVRRQVLDNLYNVETTDYDQMIDQLKGMLLDTDSRVRQAAVRFFAKR